MQTTSAREWRVCRSYDPAIDLTPQVDVDGEPLMRDTDGRSAPVLASDTIEFLRTRDPAHLAFVDGWEPAWFVLRPLTVRQLREHVGAAEEQDEKFLRAFECSIVRVDNWRGSDGQRDPVSIAVARDTRSFGRAKDGELDAMMAVHGLTMADFWDVGASAYCRAVVPLGLGAQLLLPRSSLVALGLMAQRSQRAAQSTPDSTTSAEARAALAATPQTAAD